MPHKHVSKKRPKVFEICYCFIQTMRGSFLVKCFMGQMGQMGQMIVEMGMIRSPHESLESISTWSSIFPDHLERISNVLKEYVTD